MTSTTTPVSSDCDDDCHSTSYQGQLRSHQPQPSAAAATWLPLAGLALPDADGPLIQRRPLQTPALPDDVMRMVPAPNDNCEGGHPHSWTPNAHMQPLLYYPCTSYSIARNSNHRNFYPAARFYIKMASLQFHPSSRIHCRSDCTETHNVLSHSIIST